MARKKSLKSSKPRKQRKDHITSPLHKRQKKVSVHLSKELSEKYKRRSVQVRKGDTVKIIRGDSSGISGKVSRVDLKRYAVYIDKIKRTKANGEEVLRPIHPSNLIITELELSDRKRKSKLEKTIKNV